MEINKVSQLLSPEDEAMHKKEHHFDDHKSFDYDQITDQIFIGTNMCCLVGLSDELLFKDVKADISVEGERIDNPIGVDYFLWLPVDDKKAPSDSQFDLGVQAIDYLVRNGIKVYVHCKHGHGRAPTLVAAFFINQGKTVQEAIDFISSRRPVVHPTDDQIKALQAYEKRIASK